MDYYQIIKRSWEIVKKEKVLWVFGMVLAAFGGGGGGGGRSLGNISNLFEQKEKISPETGEKVAQVLGAATSDPKAFFISLFDSIPVSFWLALGFGILLFLLFYLILGIFLRNWATGALFSLSSEADQDGKLTLAKGSLIGRQRWRRLFLVSLVIKGGFILATVFALIFFGLLLVLSQGTLKIIIGLFLAILVAFALIFAIVTSLWEVFAEIVVALENYPLKKALSFSWVLTRNFFWQGLVMGIINFGLGCLVGCLTAIVYFVLAGIIVVGLLVNRALGMIFLVEFGLPLLVFFLMGILIAGVLRALTSCNWVLFYQELKNKEKFPRGYYGG